MKKRLTDNEFHTKENKERACYIQEPRLQAIYDKLFDLEDIEEELGIDFILITKAKSVFIKDANNDIYEMVEFGWDFFNKRVIGLAGSPTRLVYACFKDYGKTWALTKEELL